MNILIAKIGKIKPRYIVGIVPFVIAIIPAIFLKLLNRLSHKTVWLICENGKMARDNGLAFFEFMQHEDCNIATFYAIDKKSPDYEKVKKYGKKVVQWSSLRHYMIYMSCDVNLSSHKEGNPNQLIFTIIQIYLNINNNRVFLQHGISHTDLKMFHYKNAKFKLFITGEKNEYEYISKNYGYKNNEVQYTGFARFDNLHLNNKGNGDILYIPTWRRQFDTKEKLLKSDYYKGIIELINNAELELMLEKYKINMIFYLHTGLMPYRELFKTNNKHVKVFDMNNADISLLLRVCDLMVTDYSSIADDFAYAKKPVIYYQYEWESYDEHSGRTKAYFNWESDGYGPIATDIPSLLQEIRNYIKNDYKVSNKYSERMRSHFILHDKENCRRILDSVRSMFKE